MHSRVGPWAEGALHIGGVIGEKLTILKEEFPKPVSALGEDERTVLDTGDLDTTILEAYLHGVMPVTTGSRVARETDVLWLTTHADFVAALVNRTGLDGGWGCPCRLPE